jgi:hypothetical protein
MSDEEKTLHDYELPYGQRVPTSYDVEAAASLLAAHADYGDATGGGLLPDDVIDLLSDVARAFARQFRDVREGER